MGDKKRRSQKQRVKGTRRRRSTYVDLEEDKNLGENFSACKKRGENFAELANPLGDLKWRRV
jgi:hypothetical protein